MKYLIFTVFLIGCFDPSPLEEDTEAAADTAEDTECALAEWRATNCLNEFGCNPEICVCDWAGLKRACPFYGEVAEAKEIADETN